MGLAELEFTKKLIELGKQLQDLQDEITRLRANMPVEVLREYDRRYNLYRQSGNKGPDAPVSRLGAAPAAGQDLTPGQRFA